MRVVVGVNREDPQTLGVVTELIGQAMAPVPGRQTTVEGWHLVVLEAPSFHVRAESPHSPAPASDLVVQHREGWREPWPRRLIAEQRLYPCIAGAEGALATDERGVLRTAVEAFCHAADVFVITTDTPAGDGRADRGFFALRLALQRGKAVIWLRHDAGTRTLRMFSNAPHPAPALRLDRLHRQDGHQAWVNAMLEGGAAAGFLDEQACASTGTAAWFDNRVWPLLHGSMHLPSAAAQHDGHEHAADSGVTEPQLLEQLLDAGAAARAPGAPARAARKAPRARLEPPAKPAPQESAFLPEPRPATAPASAASPIDEAPAGGDSTALDEAFAEADERANVAAKGYRNAVRDGYALAFVAVFATAWSVVFESHPHTASREGTWAALMWLVSIGASIGWMVYLWRGSGSSWRIVQIGRLATLTIIVTLIGGAVLPTWFELPAWTSAVEIGALVVAAVRVVYIWSARTHERWMAKRTFAEALRCDRVLRPLALRSRLSSRTALEAPDDATRRARGPVLASALAWHIARVHARQPLPPAPPGTSELHLARVAHLQAAAGPLAALIDEQLAYHLLRSRRQQALGHRLHVASNVAFLALAACALLHAFVHEPPWVASTLQLLLIALPALAAALHGIAAQLEFGRLAAQSASIARRLSAHQERLQGVTTALRTHADEGRVTAPWRTVEELRAVALDATDAMSSDAGAWFELVSARPVQLVA